MVTNDEHDAAIQSLYNQFRQIFETSTQSIYLYLDDTHKICNENYATLLGYDSAEEWAEIDSSLLETTVDETSQETLVSAYQDAVQKMVGSSVDITWKKKSGDVVNTSVILVPVSYQGHILALHFVTVKE